MRERMAARAAPSAAQQGSGGSVLLGRGPGGPSAGGNANRGSGMTGAMRQRMQERFNQQFAAFRATLDDKQKSQWDAGLGALVTARRAPVYKLVDGRPQPAIVRIGVSDGSSTEVSGEIAAGDLVVVGAERAAQAKSAQ